MAVSEFPLSFNCLIFDGNDGKAVTTGSWLSNWFLPTDSVCNFDRLDIGFNELIVSTFSSQLNDLRSFSCDSLPRFCILFFDTSNVRREVILLEMFM